MRCEQGGNKKGLEADLRPARQPLPRPGRRVRSASARRRARPGRASRRHWHCSSGALRSWRNRHVSSDLQ
eukprot:751799-Pyramimonas_sp.AAC.1